MISAVFASLASAPTHCRSVFAVAPEGLDCGISNSLGIMEIAIHLPRWHPCITAYAACCGKSTCYRMEGEGGGPE